MMAIKTILCVTGVDQGDRDLRLGVELCEQVNAHLSVLAIILAAPPPVGEYAAMVSDAWMTERQADMQRLRERTDAISTFLAGAARSADVTGAYPEIAAAEDVVGRRGRYADLTLIGPDLLETEALRDKAIEGALFSSAKPVFLAPDGSHPMLNPKQVLLAWDSSVEASRAVCGAIEMLAGAEDVRLTIVDPVEGEAGHGAEPGADAAAYLTRHGVKVTVDRLPSAGKTVAATLRRHAVDTGAELMVMGAYGHSRMRERVFGGVTRTMLNDPPLPVLLAR